MTTPSPLQQGMAQQEGWQTVLAIDFDKWAARTYAANFPDVDVRCASVADELDRLPDADVILGGPPCQPHSLAGKRGASKDKRDCGPDFVAAIARKKPRMFLMENVDGLMSSEEGRYAQRLFASMEDAGYAVQVRVLDAVDFGVPQFRNRCWWWGVRRDLAADGIRHRWPRATHAWPPPQGASLFGTDLLSGVTVREALGLVGMIRRDRGAGMLERGGDRRDFSTDEPCQTLTADNNGGAGCRLDILIQSHADAPVSIDRPANAVRSGGDGHDGCCLRLLSRPSPTLVGGSKASHTNGASIINDRRWRDAFHEYTRRRLTPAECLRLQSGDDRTFVWPDDMGKTNKYRVIGNGWACGMAARFSDALRLADPDSHTVIDLFCGGGLGAVGWHGRAWTYQPQTLEVA